LNSFVRTPWQLSFALTLALLLSLISPGAVRAQAVQPSANQAAAVSEHLQRQLAASSGPVSFLVIMAEQVDAATLIEEQGLRGATRRTRAYTLYEALTTVAKETQAPVRSWLDGQGIPFRSFYLVNMIEVYGDAAVVAEMRQLPGVARLVANPPVGQQLAVAEPHHTWLKPLLQGPLEQSQALPYGIEYTKAPDVWAMGYLGQGIVIASQDTGVEWDHPALQAKYRGVVSDTVAMTWTVDHVYNWLDAWPQAGRPPRCESDPQTPCDDHGHGTHTVGTLLGDATAVGDTILGMAPDAQWIGCRNMDHGVGTPASYTACFEFFLAPYPQGGDPLTDGRPELAPHIINNSWGCPPAEGCDAESLRQVVETVRAAGQMVVASAGNSGSSCSSVKDPIAIYDATFSVGAHNSLGNLALFSSRGPVTVDGSNRRKPDLTAPGVGIRSATVNGGYSTLNGTSMASPHVAGAVALLWSAAPNLIGQIDLTEQVLFKAAAPAFSSQCDGGGDPVIPNNAFGYGRLDVLAAVQLARQPINLTVQVVDLAAAPVAGMAITVTDQLTGYSYTGVTGEDGAAALPAFFAGEYQVTTAGGARYESAVITLAAGEVRQVELRELSPTNHDDTDEPALQPLYLPLIQR
jgi:subtilisin family serine protease